MKTSIHKKYALTEMPGVSEIEKPFPLEDEILVLLKAISAIASRTDCLMSSVRPLIMRFIRDRQNLKTGSRALILEKGYKLKR